MMYSTPTGAAQVVHVIGFVDQALHEHGIADGVDENLEALGVEQVRQVISVPAGRDVVDDAHLVAARDEPLAKFEPMNPAPPVIKTFISARC